MVISATEFKAKCLQLLDRVKLTGERIQVTKHGKVVAELGPPASAEQTHGKPGLGRDSITIIGNIIDPLDEPWEAME